MHFAHQYTHTAAVWPYAHQELHKVIQQESVLSSANLQYTRLQHILIVLPKN